MAQVSKSAARRGKPSYIMSIIGVTLVLFLLGILGWLTISSRKLVDYFKEKAMMHVYLKPDITDTARTNVQNYISAQPYIRTVQYIDKEAAMKQWQETGGEDFTGFLQENLLPPSIDLTLKAEYVDSVRVDSIQREISRLNGIDEIIYPKGVVTTIHRYVNIANVGLGILAIIIAIAVIVLIDNTIRLAMFSNRFLIKTMQMVGATRGFIARPLNIRAIINGTISAGIAIVMVYGMILLAQSLFPDMVVLRDNNLLLLLFAILLVIGISITLISTYRSVLKYLRLKLDELY